jgi:hypothetical protein
MVILLIASLSFVMVSPSSAIPEADADGPPIIKYEDLTWHHDCSNTTGFELNSTWDLSWHQSWQFSEGPLLCDGESISLFSGPLDGQEYLWTGPVFTLELPLSFTLDEFISFSVDFEITNMGEPEEESLCYVHLVDSNYTPIISLFWTDNFELHNLMRYGVRYWKFEQSSIGFTTNPVTNRTLRHESVFLKDEGSELRFSIPTIERHELILPDDEELLRNISHVVIMYGGNNRHNLVQSYLHGLTLEFKQVSQDTPLLIDEGPLDSPDPNRSLRAIHPSTLFGWCVSLVSVAVIIIFASKTLPNIIEM